MYVRRTPRVSAALPWLYLKGVSSGKLSKVLLGDQAKGLSANVLGRLKAQWSEEYKRWSQGFSGREAIRVLVGGRHLHHLARRG
jgi:hypothetical protein